MTMRDDLMARLLKGWTTPLDALRDCGCLSLSQRCGEFRHERRWNILRWNGTQLEKPPLISDKWVKLPNGKRVKAYRAIK